MERIKLQIACLCFVLFISLLFFSVRRNKNYVHKIFSFLLITNIVNLIFDAITVYTVNHLDTVSPVFNRFAHQIFIGSINVYLYLLTLYIVALIDARFARTKLIKILLITPLFFTIIAVLFGELYYMETPRGNYSYGPVATTCYISVGIYLFLSLSLIIRFWKLINQRKRNVVFYALAVMTVGSMYQATDPAVLISSMGSFLISLSIFLTMENPDKVLMELYGEEKQRADAANRAKSTFLANMSHEIRTPINAVIGMNEMILREYDDPTLIDYASNIKSASKTLLSIINDILDFSKIESGKMEINAGEYELSSSINDLINMILVKMKDKGLELKLNIATDIPNRLYGDEVRNKQIVTNLLTNAVNYTQEGSVTLSVQWVPLEDDLIELMISVEDTGNGIKEKDIAKLFESFGRLEEERNRNIEGTGLGMSITVQLLEMMGSKLNVQSVYDEGSTFAFSLKQKVLDHVPIGDFRQMYEHSVLQNSKYRERFTASEARILIVDDNEMNLKVACGLLKQTRIHIDAASSGRECLALIGENYYHAIFLDHMMPDMDGIETLNRMKQLEKSKCKGVPVIILTANAISGAKEMYIKSGFDDFLSKPIDTRKFEEMLIKYLPEDIVTITEDNNGIVGISKARGILQIENLDINAAIARLNSKELFMETIKLFYTTIPSKADLIRQYEKENRIKEYITQVHALKSSAQMIGANQLAELAEYLENCGNIGKVEEIHQKTGNLLEMFVHFREVLKPYVGVDEKQEDEKTEVKSVDIKQTLLLIKSYMEVFDIDAADALITELDSTKIPDEMKASYGGLKECVANVDVDKVIQLVDSMTKDYLL